MKVLIALMAALILILVGCQSTPTEMQRAIPDDFDLKLALYKSYEEQKVNRAPTLASCENWPPDPLPVVSYEVGEAMGNGPVIEVPIYMNTEGRRSQGGLLFLQYDDKRLHFFDVKAGPAWDNADFRHVTINDQIPGKAIFILLGWELTEEGFAYGIPETDEPWAYLVFETVKPGKAKIGWDPLPADMTNNCYGSACFYRRGEMLLDIDDAGRCVWDTVDYYTVNGVNTTGTLTVDPGFAIVTGR